MFLGTLADIEHVNTYPIQLSFSDTYYIGKEIKNLNSQGFISLCKGTYLTDGRA